MSDLSPLRLVMVGIGGCGASYLAELLGDSPPPGVKLVGAVDPRPEGSPFHERLVHDRIPIADSLSRLLDTICADLVVIASPIHWHAEQTCQALAHGAHVLCEKPAAGAIQDVHRMMAAETTAGRRVGIGFQWAFAPSTQALKQDILSGRFGRPRRMRGLVCWPRSKAYYRRPWAGRLRDDDGRWILDSPINNAAAHYLHHLLYVLGKTVATSAVPGQVQAELYRANSIESFDCGALRCITTDGVEIVFYAAHAVDESLGPIGCLEFEQATITYPGDDPRCFMARLRDGTSVDYALPGWLPREKLDAAIAAVRDDRPMVCGLAAAAPHTMCVNSMHDSCPEIVSLPRQAISTQTLGDDEIIVVPGLTQALSACYDRGLLPSETGTMPWARSGSLVDTSAYSHFPNGFTTMP